MLLTVKAVTTEVVFGGLSWMSEVQAENNVIFIGNSTTIGRGPADSPLFYPSFNNTEANIIYAVNNYLVHLVIYLHYLLLMIGRQLIISLLIIRIILFLGLMLMG
jgi:hypothetical protein